MDRTKPVAFLVSRLMSGSYVAFRETGDVLTEEPAVAARGAAAASGGDAEDESAETALLHSEEQVRAGLQLPRAHSPCSRLSVRRSTTLRSTCPSSRR